MRSVKKPVIIMACLFLMAGITFGVTKSTIPHASELAFIEQSDDIKVFGSVIPASCESSPYPLANHANDCSCSITSSGAGTLKTLTFSATDYTWGDSLYFYRNGILLSNFMGSHQLNDVVPAGATYTYSIVSANTGYLLCQTWVSTPAIPPDPVINVSCPTPGSTMNLWWGSAGATYYDVRINDVNDAWSGACPVNAAGGDYCANGIGGAVTRQSTPGHTYTAWIHACNASGCSSGANSTTFTCTLPPIYGACGGSNNSCVTGTLSDVADNVTTYLWNCLGNSTGSNASCSYTIPIYGACGGSNNSCVTGTLSDVADNVTTYLWNCLGNSTGSNASCSAVKPLPNLVSQNLGISSGVHFDSFPITVSATVKNEGTNTTSIGFTDKFSYQWNGTGGAWTDISPSLAKSALAIGGTSSDSAVFTPNNTGVLYIQHCVDAGNGIEEGSGETPNCSVSAGITIYPKPTGSLSVTSPVNLNSSSLIKWNTSNTSGCVVNVHGSNGNDWNNISSNVSGASSSPLLSDTTFTLSCPPYPGVLGFGTVTVEADPILSVSRHVVTQEDDSVTLDWDTNNGDETTCTLKNSPTGTNLINQNTADPNTGSVDVQVGARTTYTLSCPNPFAGARLIDTVIVEILPRGFES